MFHHAYTLFFMLVLAGCAFSLWRMIERHAAVIAASLRSELPIIIVCEEGPIHVRRERRPALPQIVFSICRP
jgi:hypothetical protein